MIAVALIVLLLVVLLTVAVIAGGGESTTVDLFDAEVSTSATGLFLTGLIAGGAAVLALWLLRVGLKKGWRQHKRIKDLERRADHTGPAAEVDVSREDTVVDHDPDGRHTSGQDTEHGTPRTEPR